MKTRSSALIPDAAYDRIQRSLLSMHFDANETVFLERELTQLRSKLFEVLYPEPVARLFVPKANDIAASAETYAFKVYRPTGVAELISYKTGQIPRVDLTADEVTGKVRPIAAAYGWDLNELREAARLGLQLTEVKARTARNAVERAIDEVLFGGTLADASGNSTAVGMNGLANNPYVIANPEGILTGSFWFAATPPDPDVILKNMTDLVIAVSNNSSNVFMADTLLLPLKNYNYVQQTPWSALTGESILTIFKKNNPQIKMVAPWFKLDTAGTTYGTCPRAIAYQKDPMVLEGVIPQEFEQLPPEVRDMQFVINCHARCGGVKVYQPLGMAYMDFALS